MNFKTLLSTILWLAGAAAAQAAVPAVQLGPFDSLDLSSGQNITLLASASDADGHLVSATFYAAGPATRPAASLGMLTWPSAQLLGVVSLSGGSAAPQFSWRPTQTGSYAVTVVVATLTSSTTKVAYFEAVADRYTMPNPTTVASGADLMFDDPGEIRTPENDSAPNIVVQNGGNLILWAGGRVDLKPGFHAYNGSLFWATVDHDMDGYSDMEESRCTSGDGIPDAWKIDHGLSIGTNYSNQPQFLAAYLASKGAASQPNPSTYQLVIRTPSNGFYGVNPQNWAITGL